MRINLLVPFDEKDAARAAGAKWDPARKTWYILDVEDLKPYARWMGKDVQKWFSKKKRKKPSKQ